jgi:hypothetical protein
MSNYSPFSGRRVAPARIELIEVPWRMRSPTGRILECGIYQNIYGYEARVGYGDNLLVSQFAKDIENARAYVLRFHDDAAKNPKFPDVPNDQAR